MEEASEEERTQQGMDLLVPRRADLNFSGHGDDETVDDEQAEESLRM
jgi:hypothetical protein